MKNFRYFLRFLLHKAYSRQKYSYSLMCNLVVKSIRAGYPRTIDPLLLQEPFSPSSSAAGGGVSTRRYPQS